MSWVSGNLCPVCKGGQTQEKSASFFVDDSLGVVIYFVCHRAKCGAKGRMIDNSIQYESRKPIVHQAKVSAKERSEALNIVSSKYGIPKNVLEFYGCFVERLDNDLFLSVPLISLSDGERIGVAKKRIVSKGESKTPKAYTNYSQDCKSKTSVFRRFPTNTLGNTLVIVEDFLSAIKIASLPNGNAVSAVPLLGSSISHQQESEIKELGIDNVVVMLDPDAQNKAVHIAIRNGWKAFPLLEKDPKDSSPEELINALRFVLEK